MYGRPGKHIWIWLHLIFQELHLPLQFNPNFSLTPLASSHFNKTEALLGESFKSSGIDRDIHSITNKYKKSGISVGGSDYAGVRASEHKFGSEFARTLDEQDSRI